MGSLYYYFILSSGKYLNIVNKTVKKHFIHIPWNVFVFPPSYFIHFDLSHIVFKNDILQTYVVRYASPPNKSIIPAAERMSQRPDDYSDGRTIVPAAGRLFQRPDDCSSSRMTVSAAERLLRHTIPVDEYSHKLWPQSPLIVLHQPKLQSSPKLLRQNT